MIITSFTLYTYSLPLIWPLFIHGEKIYERNGIVLELTSDTGVKGFGEIAPLPTFSNVTMNDALSELEKICPDLIDLSILGSAANFNTSSLKCLDKRNLSSPVRFGIEMAVLNIAANCYQLPLNRLLSPSVSNTIAVNGLLQGLGDSLEDSVHNLLENGFKTIKVKISGNVAADIKHIKSVLSLINNRAQIHIDANQKLNFDDAVTFANEIGTENILYIEEPFANLDRIADFYTNTQMPIALDESISSLSYDLSALPDGVKYLILKPTMLGSIVTIQEFMQKAKRHNITPIISSSFESSLGLLTLAHLAGSITDGISAGLDTQKWFKADLLKHPLTINNGQITLSEKNISADDICFDRLTRI